MSHRLKTYITLFSVAGLFVCGSAPSMKTTDDSPSEQYSALPTPLPFLAPPPIDPTPALVDSQSIVEKAVAAAIDSVPAYRTLPEEPLDYRDILNPDRSVGGSLSQGTIRQGYLRNAAALSVEGDHHQIIERHRQRNTRYGTAELVGAIERAGREVHDQLGGAPLRVGNIGFRSGGPIPWSASHQAGRDADIAFYVLDEDGASIPAPDLIEFDDDGRSHDPPLQFDVPRNWALVRALLNDPEIKVQWLFISEGLKILLIEHAIEIDEPRELIDRAAKVLHQPTDAAPHDDHLHLRVGCARIDRLEGCLNWGPQWEWHHWHEPNLLARTRQLQRAFDDPDPEIRLQALQFLRDISSPYAPEVALQSGIVDDDEAVREKAYEVLDELPIRTDAGVHMIAQSLERDDIENRHRRVLYRALRDARSDTAADIAFARYRRTDLDDNERMLAIDALAHRMNPRLVPKLIDALGEETSPVFRERLALQLFRLTARSDDVDWSAQSLNEVHAQALREWEQWWKKKKPDPDRQSMLLDMLAQYGVEKWEQVDAIDDLIPLLRTADPHIAYNINRVLSEWTGRWVPRQWDHPNDGYRFWTRWWNRNRERILDDTPRPWDSL